MGGTWGWGSSWGWALNQLNDELQAEAAQRECMVLAMVGRAPNGGRTLDALKKLTNRKLPRVQVANLIAHDRILRGEE